MAAIAHYNLGLVAQAEGRERNAIESFAREVRPEVSARPLRVVLLAAARDARAAEIERLVASGVDWIETDDPERLQQLLG